MSKCGECGEKKNPVEAKFCAKCGTALGAESKSKTIKRVTPVDKQIEILAELWLNYRDNENFADFFEYNDIGLPLAYMLDNEIVELTSEANGFIQETFALLLSSLEIDEDEGYESLDYVLGLAGDDYEKIGNLSSPGKRVYSLTQMSLTGFS